MVERFVFIINPIILLLLARVHVGFVHRELPVFVFKHSQLFYKLLLNVSYSLALLL